MNRTTTTAHAWTNGDRLTSVRSPTNTLISYARNANGRITTVTTTPPGGGAKTVVSNATYLPFGPLASYKLGNGQTVTRTYDANYALTDLVSPTYNWHGKRDAMGNVAAIGNSAGASPATETYSYDPLYRLTQLTNASGATVESYTYNKTGDRLSKTGSGQLTGTYTYQDGTHRLAGVGTTTRQLDANGNTTADVLASGTWGYGYNTRNRMTVVQQNGATVGSYVYNALGQRISKTAGSVATRFDYTEASQLLSESTTAGSRDYVWMDDLPVAVIDNTPSGSTTTSVTNYVYADGLGTPRVVANSTGTVIWQWANQGNAFGEQPPTTASGYVLNMRFPGQYADAESDMAYNVNRDYEAPTGRYLQSDPRGLAAGLSSYVYVASNPLDRVDPDGLQAERVSPLPGPTPGPSTGTVPNYGPPGNDPFGASLPSAPGLCSRLLGGVGLYLYSTPTADSCDDEPVPPPEDKCPGDKPCPPCMTASGKIVPVGTIAYRPLDNPSQPQHGIVGPHYNIYRANQAPRNSQFPCKCFWQSVGAVPPSELPGGAIPIEPFSN